LAATASLKVAEAKAPHEIAIARSLLEEYAASLGEDLCLQGFEEELATLPGKYAPPDGRLLLARQGPEIAGCVALRRLDQKACEMKRLYVRPAFRGRGVGRILTEEITRQAMAAGYRCMRLDTLPTMVSALTLYHQLGFREIPSYQSDPVDGALFLELQFDRAAT
jgi:ribosomal protein S18 acetylase RimI-like enzyme